MDISVSQMQKKQMKEGLLNPYIIFIVLCVKLKLVITSWAPLELLVHTLIYYYRWSIV